MFGLKNRHRLPDAVKEEFEKLTANLTQFLSVEHTETGHHNIGNWQDYDVQWTVATNPAATRSIGNGLLTGRFTQIGKTVWFEIELIIGTTTILGVSSNPWAFSLPVLPARRQTRGYIGHAAVANFGPGVVTMGDLFNYTGSVSVVYPSGGSYGYAYDTSFGWSDGDHLHLQGVYEAA